MTDKRAKTLSNKVNKIVHEWRNILGLSDHRIRIKFVREKHNDGSNTIAVCYPLWEYKHHTLEFYLPEVESCESDEELVEDIVHELMHIILAPATGNDVPDSNAQREKNEFAVQSATYAVLFAYGRGVEDGKT